jgi:hypothetical protein
MANAAISHILRLPPRSRTLGCALTLYARVAGHEVGHREGRWQGRWCECARDDVNSDARSAIMTLAKTDFRIP